MEKEKKKRIKRRKYLVSGGEKERGECLDKERLLSVDEMKN